MRAALLAARGTGGVLLRIAPILAAAWCHAQPSGGPYGPIDRIYEIPKAARVFYVAPDGLADAPGRALTQPTTLEAAIERVVTGDAIVLRGGVYRTGGLMLNQGITLQPYLGERPELKGTRIATQWEALGDHVWRTPWNRLFPAAPAGSGPRDTGGMRTPLHRFHNDMVFLDGQLLQSAGSTGELDAHSYYIDYPGGHVYLGVDPAGRRVEITAHDSALVWTSGAVHGKISDRKGPVILGITFTAYAHRALEVEGRKHVAVAGEPADELAGPSDPATGGKEVTGTRLENVRIKYCSRAAGYFRGDGLVIRNSLISDTSTEGISVIGSSGVLLERNIFRRNNNEPLTGDHPAAVRVSNQAHRVTVRDNLILENPKSTGVWYGAGTRDGVFVNNWVEGAINGFFLEMSRGATVAGNVFVDCDRAIYIRNSMDARIFHNTFLDAPADFERTRPNATGEPVGPGPAADPGAGHVFARNLLVASGPNRRPLIRFEEPDAPCEQQPRAQVRAMNGNVYVRASSTGGGAPPPLATWGPAAAQGCRTAATSLEEFRHVAAGWEAGGRQLDRTPRSIFRAFDLDRYELLEPLPPAPQAAALPAGVRKLLGWSEQDARTTGAYPFRR